jgi:hypothetical protein
MAKAKPPSDKPKRSSKPRHSKKKVAKLIEDLPFLSDIDEMLLENTPGAAVAKFIQKERGELTDVNPESLANALLARQRQIQSTDGWWGAPRAEVVDQELLTQINYRRVPETPGKLVRSLYGRTEGGIKDMLELEGLFLAARDRTDRLLELEAVSGAFGDITTKAMDSASEMLWKRIQARAKMNVGDEDSLDVNLSIRNYSQRTVEVLSNPESRHRIMSLLERLTRFGKSKVPLPPVALPLPQPTEE